MIKVAIAGADDPLAGEIIRILVHHPEVILSTLSAPGREGVEVSKLHHGLVGNEIIRFSGPLTMTPDCSILFVCGNAVSAVEIMALQLSRPDIKIVITRPVPNLDEDKAGVVFGLPEINRKQLVRGATTSRLPSPISVAALVALYPLALNMLLNDTLKITVKAPGDIVARDGERSKQEILDVLSETQLSFTNTPEIRFEATAEVRQLEMEIEMNCNVSLDHILEIYGIYDDHNFAYPVTGEINEKETAGTAKCVFSVQTPEEGKLKINVSLDPRMRGGATEAVHNMNLLFGLHEKTGLELKASEF